MNSAYPGGTCMRRLDHEEAGGGHADRGVDVVDLARRPRPSGPPRRRRRWWCPPSMSSSPHSRTPRASSRRWPRAPRRRSPAAAGPGCRAGRRSRRCACWWPARGSRARSRSGSTAARSRRTRRPCSGRRRGRSRRRSRRSRRGRPPWAPRGTAGRRPATAPTPAGGEYMLDAWPPLWLIWAKIGDAVAVHGVGDPPVAGDAPRGGSRGSASRRASRSGGSSAPR